MTLAMKSTIFWYVTTCSLVMFTDVSEESKVSIFRVEEKPNKQSDSD
jgi:hypothetical protein